MDLINLVKLSFENDEVSSLLRIKINNLLFKLFKSVNDLEEVSVIQEEAIVSLFDSLDDFFDWVQEGVLVEVSLQGTMLEFLESIK